MARRSKMIKEREFLKRIIEENYERIIIGDELFNDIKEYLSKPEKKPLSYEEIVEFFKKDCRFYSHDLASFNRGIRISEKHHGIGKME
jgi:hypothetical protein